ncbi:phosphoglycerate kinase [Candidatus Giovannonibacteria bacterium]|nr:phosphoglycerate kinase [Candidatus Giovannonibacteria bacterium]
MKSLKSAKVGGKRVLVRVDFNVFPPKHDELRIVKTLPTLKYLLSKKAKVIMLTHYETNQGEIPSVRGLADILRKNYFPKLKFSETNLAPGEISILENLRKDSREKECDEGFAGELATLGDIYVNEAFAASHRKHTSIFFLPKLLPSYPGFLFENEIKNLSKVFKPSHPFTLILGGGKVETKLPLLEKLLPKADYVLLGGVLLNLFIMEKKSLFSPKLILPKQIISSGKKVLDVGPESFPEWKKIINKSKLVVWNGPLGYLEKGHIGGTRELISILSRSKNRVILGGGDTLDCLPASKRKFPKNIFISTGGGAMLDYLVKGTLPGIEALG